MPVIITKLIARKNIILAKNKKYFPLHFFKYSNLYVEFYLLVGNRLNFFSKFSTLKVRINLYMRIKFII
jgi:hypothetical protein